jgi:hypothetical protein
MTFRIFTWIFLAGALRVAALRWLTPSGSVSKIASMVTGSLGLPSVEATLILRSALEAES